MAKSLIFIKKDCPEIQDHLKTLGDIITAEEAEPFNDFSLIMEVGTISYLCDEGSAKYHELKDNPDYITKEVKF